MAQNSRTHIYKYVAINVDNILVHQCNVEFKAWQGSLESNTLVSLDNLVSRWKRLKVTEAFRQSGDFYWHRQWEKGSSRTLSLLCAEHGAGADVGHCANALIGWSKLSSSHTLQGHFSLQSHEMLPHLQLPQVPGPGEKWKMHLTSFLTASL